MSGVVLRPLTVLRYSGGKRWFIGHAKYLVEAAIERGAPRPARLLEPFAGGATVGLTLLNSDLVDRLILCELDPRVATFWKTVLTDSRFADRVERFRCTRKNVLDVCKHPDRDPAFWTLVKNRTSFGGNLTGGLMRNISSRWNGAKLATTFRQIFALSGRIKFVEGDALTLLRKYADDSNAAAFVDPPYVQAGKVLYRHWQLDHAALFDVLASWKGFWLLTYDHAPEIDTLVSKHQFAYRYLGMQANLHGRKKETMVWSRHLPHCVTEPVYLVPAKVRDRLLEQVRQWEIANPEKPRLAGRRIPENAWLGD